MIDFASMSDEQMDELGSAIARRIEQAGLRVGVLVRRLTTCNVDEPSSHVFGKLVVFDACRHK